MIFMDIGTERYKTTFADIIRKYRKILISILVIILYFFIKDLITQRDIMVYDTNLQYLYTIDTNKGKSIKHAPDIEVSAGYSIVWYDNPEFEGSRIGFPYLVKDDGGVYPKLVGNFFSLEFDPNNGGNAFWITKRYNAIVEEPDQPIKNGYTFVGWLEEDSHMLFIFDRMPLNGANLYARWIRNPDN